MPILTVIAGPNGSGKSTVAGLVDLEGRDRLLDADAAARDLNPISPSSASIAAGREVLRRTADYLNQGVSFAIETTLSSRGRLEMIRKAKFCGYRVHLLFIGVDSPERCIWRIRNRVTLGGHFVPAADVRRRYARSMANVAEGLRVADRARVFDNSGDHHRETDDWLPTVVERNQVRPFAVQPGQAQVCDGRLTFPNTQQRPPIPILKRAN